MTRKKKIDADALNWWLNMSFQEKFNTLIWHSSIIDGDDRNPDSLTDEEIELLYNNKDD